ncbi:hypothetical protein AKO1_002715 [Acrasis kona]|uniref:Uncharacterized protein n=1 Tax=Acrasis kona TaxID=1008807 RepID=A0AAW2ZEF4_9EUKA
MMKASKIVLTSRFLMTNRGLGKNIDRSNRLTFKEEISRLERSPEGELSRYNFDVTDDDACLYDTKPKTF